MPAIFFSVGSVRIGKKSVNVGILPVVYCPPT